ncbi:metallophosphoesterase [Bacillus sp. CECT 9360]|uniref:metallophosphoesterase n=1 Tax=Bacillus sp. CECT 9360 TaxID=2845821 RepID=UPI001E4727E2|nr:metallophosphoesterase [Bacillus sp. CECT 9360]CAH0346517.1 3',5'-cyclic adenosine monophosphate phosphodiesterase CpdA [Bacillus sp. CECT 9360]
MGTNEGRLGITQKVKVWGAAFAIGLSLIAGTSASAEPNEHKSKKPAFEFGLIPDIQYCDCDASGTRFYRDSVSKLKDAAAILNQHKLSFTVQTGDIIDRNLESFDTILPIYNQVEGPKYHVLGNHDFPVTTDKVVDILDMPNQYYDFAKKGWRFIVLDTNDLSLYANAPGSAKYQQAEEMYNQLKTSGTKNAQVWNGGVGSDQMNWLHNVLQKSANKEEKVVVIGHMPIYPANEHNAWNDAALMKELESAGNVVAYFNGHNHAGNYAEKNGIKYVNFQGMVETADSTAFSVIRAYKDRLEIDGYGREPDRVLKVNPMEERDGKHEVTQSQDKNHGQRDND